MNEKVLKLMIEDFSEIYRTQGVEIYPIYQMEMFDDYKSNQLEKFWETKDAKYPYLSGDFDEDKSWFIKEENYVRSIDEEELTENLLNNKDTIINKYYEAEELYENVLMNNNEIRSEILEECVIETEVDEDDEIIYQDVNIEAIAETLAQLKLKDLYANLVGYGSTMSIVKSDDMFSLLQ